MMENFILIVGRSHGSRRRVVAKLYAGFFWPVWTHAFKDERHFSRFGLGPLLTEISRAVYHIDARQVLRELRRRQRDYRIRLERRRRRRRRP